MTTLMQSPPRPGRTRTPTRTPAQPRRARALGTKQLGLLLALALGAAIWFGLPAANGLTHEGVRALAVIIPSIVLWLTMGTNWVSLLIMGLFVIGGVMPNGGAGNAWATSLGNPIIALIITFYILANTMADTGVIDTVAAWFISRPFLRGRPYAFMTMFFLSQMLLGLVMQNLALAVIYIELAEKICKQLDVKKGDKLYDALMLGVTYGNGVLLVASPIAKTWPLVMIGMLAVHGIEVSFATWFAIGIPFTFAMTVVIITAVRQHRPDVSPLKNLDVDELRRSTPPLSKSGKIVSAGMTLLVAFIVIPELLAVMGVGGPLIPWMISIGITAPATVLVALLCMTNVDGKPLCNFGRSLSDIHWGVVIFVAATFIIQAGFSNPETGIQAWLAHVFQPVFGNLSPFWLTVLAMVGTLVVTQFMVNGLTMTLFWTIGSSLLVAYSGTAHLAGFGIAVLFASCFAVFTAPATLTTALVYEPGHLKPLSVFRPNLVFASLALAVTIGFIPFINTMLN